MLPEPAELGVLRQAGKQSFHDGGNAIIATETYVKCFRHVCLPFPGDLLVEACCRSCGARHPGESPPDWALRGREVSYQRRGAEKSGESWGRRGCAPPATPAPL